MAIYVDFDGTLATYYGWDNKANGEPIPAMVKRVKEWIQAGETVVLFTARVSEEEPTERDLQVKYLQEWCEIHLGTVLKITCIKGTDAQVFIDDRAFHCLPNLGVLPYCPVSKYFHLNREIRHVVWTLRNHVANPTVEALQVFMDTTQSMNATTKTEH